MQTVSSIKNRKTVKVLSDNPWPQNLSKKEQDDLIPELLELASFAPYHHKCNPGFTKEDRELSSCLPYRFYTLSTQECRKLAVWIKEQQINAGKIPQMLHTADLLFLVTWLPEPNSNLVDLLPEEEQVPFDGSRKNMEHIAAASAAIQNVLIGATAKKIPSYWSSGGPLRKKPIHDLLKIQLDEILLGSIFLFPKHVNQTDAKIIEGHLRNEGKQLETWSKMVEFS